MYDDADLNLYRNLMKPHADFEEGFDWKTVVGAVSSSGFLMMPGSMYLQLVIGYRHRAGRPLGNHHSCSLKSPSAPIPN